MTDDTEPKPNLHSIMRQTLNDYHLSNMTHQGTNDAFPLVDLLSNEAVEGKVATIESGRQEIDLIVDQLATELIRQAPDTSSRRILDVLGVDTGADAALNLDGAIDSLLIAHKLSEDDTIIRTLRRVLGQIEEAARLAEMQNARCIAG